MTAGKITTYSIRLFSLLLVVLSVSVAGCSSSRPPVTTPPVAVMSDAASVAGGSYVSPLAAQLPYAYYPSSSEMEVAFDIASPLLGSYFGPMRPAVENQETVPGLAYALYNYGDVIPPYDFERKPRDPKKIDFSLLSPFRTGVLNNVRFDMDDRSTGWCAAFSGYIDVPGDAVYTFNIRPFSNLKLYIDGQLVGSTLEDLTYNWKGFAAPLKAGRHAFALSYIAYTIERVHPELPPEMLRVSAPGMQRQPVPDSWFSHNVNQERDLSVPASSSDVTNSLPPAALRGVRTVSVEVLPVGSAETVVRQEIALNAEGKAQVRFSIPELPDGEYRVEYVVAGKRILQPMTFRREHFPFEGNDLGIEHKVYPPFERLTVDGQQVTMVQRTYTMNPFGTFSSVISKGREILAEPMKLVCETADGREAWTVTRAPSGYTPYVDEAIFSASASCEALDVDTKTVIEEDGCARVEMRLAPGHVKKEIRRLWLEIVMPDAEAPMFTYVNAGEFLRSYYGGKIPRGKNIRWDITGKTNFLRAPSMWTADPGSADGVVFDATHDADTASNFLPYLWMGAAERGIAWFTGEDRYYENDGKQSMLELARVGDKVVLRIYFIRKPVTLDAPRTMTFGLVASPTKPMRPDWRTHDVPGGGGLPVIAWGAYRCADKYPDNRDFSIVDKILEARRNKQPVDMDFFRYKDQNRLYKDWTVYETPWLPFVTQNFNHLSCTYFEEHFIQSRNPEWQVFQDEWAHVAFNRFRPRDANGVWLYHNHYGCTARSYRDFALYYANEWLKRGVSLYFDNTYPKLDANPYTTGVYGGRSTSLWTQRAYYRRIYKLLSYYNEKGSEWPLDFTVHMTNSPTIPINTWATSFLDLEQPYRRTEDGTELPFPPDYTLSMTLGRTVGVIPHIMYPLRNIGPWTTRGHSMNEHQQLSNWGMSAVHELSPRKGRGPNTLAQKYNSLYREFGYPEDVVVHTYWEDDPYLTTGDDEVYWIALTKAGSPVSLVVLQSYAPAATTARLHVPGGKVLKDAETGALVYADANGEASVTLGADYGTRMFFVSASPDDLKDQPVVSSRVP